MLLGRFVVLSGCSGGGKSTLLDELARRGYATVDEPGRRIVKDETRDDGQALPWVNPVAFAQRAIRVALADLSAANAASEWVFFDRGLVDAVAALRHVTGDSGLPSSAPATPAQLRAYHRLAFLAPPWPEIYVNDGERRHGFDEAVSEYVRLVSAYRALGYLVIILPKLTVEDRADFVLHTLRAHEPEDVS